MKIESVMDAVNRLREAGASNALALELLEGIQGYLEAGVAESVALKARHAGYRQAQEDLADMLELTGHRFETGTASRMASGRRDS